MSADWLKNEGNSMSKLPIDGYVEDPGSKEPDPSRHYCAHCPDRAEGYQVSPFHGETIWICRNCQAVEDGERPFYGWHLKESNQ